MPSINFKQNLLENFCLYSSYGLPHFIAVVYPNTRFWALFIAYKGTPFSSCSQDSSLNFWHDHGMCVKMSSMLRVSEDCTHHRISSLFTGFLKPDRNFLGCLTLLPAVLDWTETDKGLGLGPAADISFGSSSVRLRTVLKFHIYK